MKILHIIQSLHKGGIEKLVFSMMQADIQNVFILAIEGNAEESYKDWPDLVNFETNLIFADKKMGFNKSVVTDIIKTCKKYSISVIHTHHIGPLIYACLAKLELKGLGHVHTEHDVWHLQRWKDWFIQYILFKLNKSIRLIAVSQYTCNELQSYFPKKEITVIHNGVEVRHFLPGSKKSARLYFKLPESAVIIGNAGRLELIKGQKYLIEAMLKLPPNFYLIIAGKGKIHTALQNQINSLNLQDRVILLGNENNMVFFYQACDLFCLSSLDEGLPLSILEAQSCNVPVVCTNVGGCVEGVDPDSGILIPVKDPEAIAKSCLILHQKRSEPREFIIKNFSFEPLLKQYELIYSQNS